MEVICPRCHSAMNWKNDNRFHCPACGEDYLREAHCPECRQPLQELKACGAVDYFCQHGHGLVSKKRVVFSLHKQQAEK
ncbi:zinc ribbon domain-containing protein [Brenneria sp. g21c3]|uniref:zinc ribbon domain-containing protein n=1 Tax=Brenneria sp. g21c3 TaxID=3093893 RepID=UPI002EA26EAF|nr:zinc ribbon domain-containing protein [Brenneria sp. g21c3]